MKHTQRVNRTNYRKLDKAANYTDFNRNAVKLAGEFETNTNYEDKILTTWKLIDGTKEPIIGMNTIPKLGIQIIIGGESLGINRLCQNNEELVKN